MNKSAKIVFAMVLLAGISFSLNDRLQFSIVDSEDLGLVAIYDNGTNWSTNCSNAVIVSGERFVKARSDYADAFGVSRVGTDGEVYYRAYVDGTNENIIYVKPSGAACYYWMKMPYWTGGIPNEGNSVVYKPSAVRDSDNILFDPQGAASQLTKITVHENMQGGYWDTYTFMAAGASGTQIRLMSPDFVSDNRLYYARLLSWGWPVGAYVIAPFVSAKGSTFVDLNMDVVEFEMRFSG